MDELIAQGQWWWLLPVPVLTFLFAVAGSWIGSALGKRTEHQQWLRNERRSEYISVAATLHDWSKRMRSLARSGVFSGEPLDESLLIPLAVLGPRRVRKCVHGIMMEISDCNRILEVAKTQNDRDKAVPHLEAMGNKLEELYSLIRQDLRVDVRR